MRSLPAVQTIQLFLPFTSSGVSWSVLAPSGEATRSMSRKNPHRRPGRPSRLQAGDLRLVQDAPGTGERDRKARGTVRRLRAKSIGRHDQNGEDLNLFIAIYRQPLDRSRHSRSAPLIGFMMDRPTVARYRSARTPGRKKYPPPRTMTNSGRPYKTPARTTRSRNRKCIARAASAVTAPRPSTDRAPREPFEAGAHEPRALDELELSA